MDDYSAYAERKTSSASLARLSELADELVDLQEEAARREAEFKRAKARADYVEQEQLPRLMTELGLKEFKTRSGLEISVAEKIFVSISEKNKADAYAWMHVNGHGGMIKRQVVVAFNKEQEDQALELEDRLMHEGYPGVKKTAEIHPSTLRAWATRRLEAGEELPPSISIERKEVAKIKKKK